MGNVRLRYQEKRMARCTAMSSQLKQAETGASIDAAPLLTIAIPTYNRAKYLRKLLTSLFDQLISEPRVELIISDNASPDETPDVVNEFMQRGLRIRSIRNEKNIGPDANFLQCFEQAKGKYVWIIGDDDVVLPHRLSQILGYIEKEVYDLIFLSGYHFHADYLAEEPRRGHRPPLSISSPERFIKLVNRRGDFIYISSLIVNKARVSANNVCLSSSLVGTNVVQLTWAFAALTHFVRGLYIDDHMIAGTVAGSDGGFNAAAVFGKNYKRAVSECLGLETRLGRLLTNQVLTRWFPRHWIAFRRSGGNIRVDDSERILRSTFGSNPRYWLVAGPLIYAPMPLAELWRKVLRVAELIRFGSLK
jgi:abequosyltransferase